MLDVAAAREAIADVGKIAVTGFCLGGTLTYGAATNLPGFSVAVGYYSGHIVRMADQPPKVPTGLAHPDERRRDSQVEAAVCRCLHL